MPNFSFDRTTVHVRSEPSLEGGEFYTTITREQDSIVKMSFATDANSNPVYGPGRGPHGEIRFTGPNPLGSIKFP